MSRRNRNPVQYERTRWFRYLVYTPGGSATQGVMLPSAGLCLNASKPESILESDDTADAFCFLFGGNMAFCLAIFPWKHEKKKMTISLIYMSKIYFTYDRPMRLKILKINVLGGRINLSTSLSLIFSLKDIKSQMFQG
jgi:hypothetical protein